MCAAFLLLLWGAQAQEPQPELPFAGRYADLLPEQRTLVDDWFQRLSDILSKHVDPAEGYNNLPLSYKTTFNAVTHALIKTKLTDKSGSSLGYSAVTIIDKIDAVAGQIPGTGGDHQFRLYVQLKPDASDILTRAQEFKRGPDNTIFHKGYPTSFRGTSGTPSIQVSVTRDKRRGDIDVDYRSSKFPKSLINGHLTASNSDVRAGNNDERHNEQWAGLQNWWRNLLGLPLFERGGPVADEEGLIASEPRVKGKPEDAVYDFLQAWLVEQKPGVAMGYLDKEVAACMEIERGAGFDRGMAPFIMLNTMRDVNERLGQAGSLDDVALGVHYTGPRVKVISQPHQKEFLLYDAREDLAEQFRCLNRLDTAEPSKRSRSDAFGKYVMAVFQIHGKQGKGDVVATLWRKSKGSWKMLSYDVDPDPNAYKLPDLSAPPETPELPVVSGDQDQIRSTAEFLSDWFVSDEIGHAMNYFSGRAFGCVNLYRDEDTPRANDPAAQAHMLEAGMHKVAEAAGRARKLEDAIVAPQPSHPDLKIVEHSNASAYAIASLPDYVAKAADCAGRTPGKDPDFQGAPDTLTYGKYYGVGFKLADSLEDPSVFWTVWAKQGAAWKIVSFAVMAP